jgi:hypothetical protein
LKGIDNLIGFISGLFGGSVRFLLDANPSYPASLLQATITALVCGAAGYLGKEIIVLLKRLLSRKK